ncbi:tol-pal system protein YbgF [Desulfovibrio psychrotolerans]|uniref:Tol-pal system protein YbgF n=1 Tax=Desulfovibrio psychrotolerans TaxID=415242 RepID=A0A7J0BXD2_9BACT|nr:tol-pal system protein YbgF [Desulfovibrio psychrotolerans]GFM38357.1 tol-pal system protein YbgF [Desulfovibrio psychrotolerans]
MHTFSRIFLVIFCLFLIPGCVNRSDLDVLEMRVADQDRQIRQMSQQLGQTSKQIEASRPEQADTWSEVQSMRSRLAAMEAQLEDMQMSSRQNEEMARKIDVVQRNVLNLDASIRAMASQLAIDLPMLQSPPAMQSSPAAPAADAAQAPAQAVQAQTPAQAPAFPAVPAVPGAADRNVLVAPDGTELVVNPGQAPRQAPQLPAQTEAATITPPGGQTPVAAPAQAVSEQQLYDAAFQAFNDRRYKDAVRMWEDFEKAFPKHNLIANSVFWQGESHYQMNDYGRAILAYQRVIDHHPKSDKYPSALLKQGISFVRMGKSEPGKVRLEELIKKFPKSPEAERAKKAIAEIK